MFSSKTSHSEEQHVDQCIELKPEAAATEASKSEIIRRAVDELKLHPACETFHLSSSYSDEFLADVAARGVQEPLAVLPDGQTVIDGHDRLNAAQEAALPMVPTRVVNPPDVEEYILNAKCCGNT